MPHPDFTLIVETDTVREIAPALPPGDYSPALRNHLTYIEREDATREDAPVGNAQIT